MRREATEKRKPNRRQAMLVLSERLGMGLRRLIQC
jgi:hypothetical protein